MTIYTQAKHDFNDGTCGPFTRSSNGGSSANISVIADPTGSGRGKVAQLLYPTAIGASTDVAVGYGYTTQAYGTTISATMDVYCANLSPAGYNIADNRKIFDFLGVSFSRATLHRVGAGGELWVSIIQPIAPTDNDLPCRVGGGSTGTVVTLADNTWARFRVVIVTNSAILALSRRESACVTSSTAKA